MTTASAARMSSARSLLWRAGVVRRQDALLACALYSGHQFGEAMVPVVIGAAISGAVAGGSLLSLVWWLAVLAADFVLLSLSYRFGARASMRAKQHAAHQVRLWTARRVLDPAGGADAAPGELLTRASSDADRIGALVGVVASTIAAAVVLIVATVLLLRFSVPLGIVILVGTVLLLLVTGRLSRRLAARSHIEQHAAADAAVLAADTVRGLRVLTGLGAENAASDRYGQASRAGVAASVRAIGTQSAIDGVSVLLAGGYLAVIAGLGGWLALSGSLGLGELVSSLGLAQFLIGPLRTVSGAPASYARARASAERVLELLNTPAAVSAKPESAGRERAPRASAPTIEFRGIPVADGSTLSFTAAAGQLTGIAVADAASAALIVRLLAREQDAASGRILIDGTDAREFELPALRSLVLVSPHDAALLDGTVGENIALVARPDRIPEATRAAFADQLITALPSGQNTEIGDAGRKLSGGQRQRVALARVLAADAPALVLHDPTTAVDAATEDRIATQLPPLRTGRTTIVVTTAPAFLARCDRVVFVRDGAAKASDHTALLSGDDDYRMLVTR
ncbi:MAG TPA: ABC transporter ATP-binding protein [Gryllotalpicola sp.]